MVIVNADIMGYYNRVVFNNGKIDKKQKKIEENYIKLNVERLNFTVKLLYCTRLISKTT